MSLPAALLDTLVDLVDEGRERTAAQLAAATVGPRNVNIIQMRFRRLLDAGYVTRRDGALGWTYKPTALGQATVDALDWEDE